jgi:hypothetical protein
MLRTQRNAQIHFVATLVVVAAGFIFGVGIGEWIALVLAITLVLALEALNTALEAVVDLASPQLHPAGKTRERRCGWCGAHRRHRRSCRRLLNLYSSTACSGVVKILFVAPYPPYPPRGGGQQRIYQFYSPRCA